MDKVNKHNKPFIDRWVEENYQRVWDKFAQWKLNRVERNARPLIMKTSKVVRL